MDAVPLQPERDAQLKEFARRCGKDPGDGLDDDLAALFDAEYRDYEEAVDSIQGGYGCAWRAAQIRRGIHRRAAPKARPSASDRSGCRAQNRPPLKLRPLT